MALTIDDSFAASSDLRSSQVGRQQEIAPEQEARQRQAEVREDSASLSSLGTELARALATDAPDVVNQIDQLQEAVSSGTFSVPADAVANSILDGSLQAQELENQLLSAQNSGQNAPPSPSAR